jgi:hypothetical protein
LLVEIEVTPFGMVDDLRSVAGNVTGAIVPDSGHWITEENRRATIKLITEFLVKSKRAAGRRSEHGNSRRCGGIAAFRREFGAPPAAWRRGQSRRAS